MSAQRPTLIHYTTGRGHDAIVSSERLRPSLLAVNPKDARHGDGQYFSDIVPGTKTPGQLAYLFLNDPRGWRRFTHFVEIDVTGWTLLEGRPGVFVFLSAGELDLTDRIVRSGTVPKAR